MISFPATAGRGRGRGVGHPVLDMEQSSDSSPPASDPDEDTVEDMQQDSQQDTQQDSQQGSQQPGASRRRQSKADATTRKPCIKANENDLAEWFSSHRELWYRGDSQYHLTSIKEGILHAKALEISTAESKCTGK